MLRIDVPVSRTRQKMRRPAGENSVLIIHASEAMGGGVQTAIARYAALLPEDRHVVLARTRARQSTYELPGNTTVEHFEGSTAGYLMWLRRRVAAIRPDVVHLHSSFAGLARPVLPKNVVVAYSPHCFAFERRDIGPGSRLAYRIVEWSLSWRSQLFVAVSPHEMETAQRLNKRLATVYVPNSLPLKSVPDTSSPLWSRPADEPAVARPSVTMVGRIGPQKQPRLFAEVAAGLSDRIDFVWVGDGDADDRHTLENAGVRVTGWLPPERAMDEVRASDLYFHCASWEGAPFAAIEAASLGTPVIALDIPSMSSIGYRTVGSEPQTIVAEIAAFFENQTHREDVERHTRDVATRFSDDELRGYLRGAYETALATIRSTVASDRAASPSLDYSTPSDPLADTTTATTTGADDDHSTLRPDQTR